MSKKQKFRDVDRPKLHIVQYLCHHDHNSSMSENTGKCSGRKVASRHTYLSPSDCMQRYVKYHIMLLFDTNLFGDKSGTSVHWKFLPLLRDFGSIKQYSRGSACLAHLYRTLCRASRFDCKKIDGPLTLMLKSNCVNEISHIRWRNWEHGDRRYGYLTLDHFRKALDDLQEGQFVWVAYVVDRVDPDIIPTEIYMHSVVWSAMVPLVSFECIEWHATDRFRRQFDLVVQENDEGNQVMDDDNQEQELQSPPSPPP
ncbi:serine/threonine-protein phosphatase 7 long form homolog [Arachis hypogaea]|uniref:serine/threonine-protein phosphatase 7 long form homolog n=1 Tax=Arachis hypogaea TaxID=3818 RepID=UPI000DEC3624|nr:serine/threonine-protein phosphatase 7 long form homolog [Arachis hypogaea]